MVSKGIALLTQTATINNNIREWIHRNTGLKLWATFQTFLHRSHCEKRRLVSYVGKGGYTRVIKDIFGVTPPLPEDNHYVIEKLNNIVCRMQTQSYELEGLAQANAVLISSNLAVMAQLAQMTAAMSAMQTQLKKLSLYPSNQTISKRKYYCWSCGSNYNNGSKT